MDGIVVVDKSAGMTSHDVVDAARRLFATTRVGHTGTLDPDATGVLVLCIGQATRLASYLSAVQKHYVAEVIFGVETDTQDLSGRVVAERNASFLTRETVEALLPRFRGTIQQIPPMVSAVHYRGQRLYELARKGIVVERSPRTVQIEHLAVVAFQTGTHPIATIEVTCSTGTYIRTLAADLGTAAQTGGCMRSLRRLRAGRPGCAFTIENAHTLDALRAYAVAGRLAQVVLPLTAAVSDWPQVRLNEAQVRRVQHGQHLRLSELKPGSVQNWPPDSPEAPVALLGPGEALCAVAQFRDDRLFPVRVLRTAE
ncbi:MAG: tRNA pseudouridine(55) synthase TruB [Chloroherpetonaceae bacterium]|nr:tRNA pseudouridine(55) synthase TruB [Chthonomonadaceae bacterium]MDW8206894.1 tRNA pseudouridine(55) synthase TruB [Chloroherpetonaceae bacterium]